MNDITLTDVKASNGVETRAFLKKEENDSDTEEEEVVVVDDDDDDDEFAVSLPKKQMHCTYIMIQGKNKGKSCGRKTKLNGLCAKHVC
jgi:hypothetical protein